MGARVRTAVLVGRISVLAVLGWTAEGESEVGVGWAAWVIPRLGGPMLRPWFTPWGWIHRPLSWPGIALVVLATAFCIQVFVAVERHSHSVSDTLYGVFPYIVPTLIVLNWVASKTSGSPRSR